MSKKKKKKTSDKVHQPYDKSFKFIFSHAVMIKDLLKGFVPEEWVQDLDFNSLQQVNVQHITDDLRSRDDDMIWKIYCKKIPIYIICLIEFQTSVEKFMAARLLTYIGLVYQDLIAAEDPLIKEQGVLPPIFPLVLYTGAAPWNAPLRLKDCFGDSIPGSLKKYQPDLQYMALDVGRMELDKYPAKADNFVKPIINLEKVSNRNEAIEVIERMAQLFKGPKLDSLRRSIIQYVTKAYKLYGKHLGIEITNLNEVNMTLFSETVERWREEICQKGVGKVLCKVFVKSKKICSFVC